MERREGSPAVWESPADFDGAAVGWSENGCYYECMVPGITFLILMLRDGTVPSDFYFSPRKGFRKRTAYARDEQSHRDAEASTARPPKTTL